MRFVQIESLTSIALGMPGLLTRRRQLWERDAKLIGPMGGALPGPEAASAGPAASVGIVSVPGSGITGRAGLLVRVSDVAKLPPRAGVRVMQGPARPGVRRHRLPR